MILLSADLGLRRVPYVRMLGLLCSESMGSCRSISESLH